MKMLKGNTSISQYRVWGDTIPPDSAVFEWAANALGSWRFESISDTADEASVGWVTCASIDSSEFENTADLHFEKYFAFPSDLTRGKSRQQPSNLKQRRLKKNTCGRTLGRG
jgi:hypothetical protein